MKLLLFIALVSLVWYPAKPLVNAPPQPQILAVNPDTSYYRQHIQPIFQQHCSPCHFTGGKMYERLPFDQAKTILNPQLHPGIFKRIKDSTEVNLIRVFIRKNSR